MVVELVARHVWQLPSTRALPPAVLRLIASLAGASYILGDTWTHPPTVPPDYTNNHNTPSHTIPPHCKLQKHPIVTPSTHSINIAYQYTLLLHPPINTPISVLVGVNLAGYAVGVGGASEMLTRLYR